MTHVLMVCTANICRSPVAAAILADRLSQRSDNEWEVSSAGTWAIVERGPAENSVLVMKEQGMDLSGHMAREVDEALLAGADLVLTMEAGHAEAIKAEFPEHKHKVFMLTEMVDRRYEISDPYGGSLNLFEQMRDEVADVIDRGLEKIVELAEANARQRS